jgi:hypothetical protein
MGKLFALRNREKALVLATFTAGLAGCIASDSSEQITTTSPSAPSISSFSNSSGYTLESVANCAEGVKAGSGKTTLFEDQGELQGGLTGWSHIVASGVYTGLGLTGTDPHYDIPGPIAADASCNNAETMRVILVKKFGNWEQQHSNGIEPSITTKKTFSDVQSIVLEFKINSEHTVLPSAALLQTTYPHLSPAQIAQLDSGKVNLAISIISPRDNEDRSVGDTDGQAQRFIEIDPVNFDSWLRVTIPFEGMNFYTVDDYRKSLSSLAALANTPVDVIQINPEIYGNRRSASEIGTFGNVVRSFTGATYTPEVFKEIDITVKKVEVIWKQ